MSIVLRKIHRAGLGHGGLPLVSSRLAALGDVGCPA
jgi:hypothetical protein